jgi:hypothetical protein
VFSSLSLFLSSKRFGNWNEQRKMKIHRLTKIDGLARECSSQVHVFGELFVILINF